VKNLPFDTPLETLHELFGKYGALRSVSPRKGFCFLEYESVDAAEALLRAQSEGPFKLADRTLHIEHRTNSKDARPKASGSGGGGGGGGRSASGEKREKSARSSGVAGRPAKS